MIIVATVNLESTSAAIDLSSFDLQSLLGSDNISLETLETLRKESENMMKRREILQKYENQIRQLPEPDGRFWIRLNGKQIFRKTRKELEDVIVERMAPTNATLNTIYKEYIEQRKLSVVPTSWQKDVRYYESYIKDSALAQMPLCEIRTKHCYSFLAYCLEIKKDMRKKYWNGIKSTLSTMFQFAIDNDLMETNYTTNIKPARSTFTEPLYTEEEDTVYTTEEASNICTMAYEDAISNNEPCCLGVALLFNLGLRAGELLGLKWKDLTISENGSMLHVQRSLVANIDEKSSKATGTTIVNRCKTKAGNRKLYISEDVLKVFKKIKEISIARGFSVEADDLILQREYDGKVCSCTSRCIDARLRKYCKHFGYVPKSAHDIRRTTITNLSNAGMSIKEIQKWAGHENYEMTEKYIRKQAGTDNTVYLNALNPLNLAE